MVAWCVIAFCVATLVIVDYRDTNRQIALNQDSGVSLELASRSQLGYVLATGPQATNDVRAKIVVGLRESAHSPADELRLAPVEANIVSQKAAAASLDRLIRSNPPPEIAEDARLMRTIYTPGAPPLDSSDRQHLIDRYGWFGKLAVSAQGDAELRKATTDAARRTFGIMMLAVLGFVAALIAGVVLAILWIVKWNGGGNRPRYRPAGPEVSQAMLEGFAVYLGGMMLLIVGTRGIHHTPENSAILLWANLLLAAPFAAALGWIRLRGIGWSTFTAAVGLTRGQGVAREMFAGLVGYITGLPILVVGFLFYMLLAKLAGPSPGHPILREIRLTGSVRLLLVFLACVFAPITEELMFRGMLLAHLRRRWGWIASALLVSVIFAAIHPQGWTTIPALGAVAVVLAALREQRDSIIASMTAHALNNFLVIMLLILAMA